METTPGGWTVIDREAGVLVHTYTFAPESTSKTFVARLADGTLMVVSPCIKPSDALLAELAEFGEVGAIVANNGFHHMGQKAWRARFPTAKCYAPAASFARIAKKNKHGLTFEPLSDLIGRTGDDVGIRDVPNTKSGESWYWAKIDGGHAWYVSDVLNNVPSLPSNFVFRMMFKLTKSGPGYGVFGLALKFMVKDVKATLRLMLEDIDAHPPTVVVPAHGGIISGADTADRTRGVIRERL